VDAISRMLARCASAMACIAASVARAVQRSV
jgi:hypothetical protein